MIDVLENCKNFWREFCDYQVEENRNNSVWDFCQDATPYYFETQTIQAGSQYF